jgi:hypothetical protein
VTDLDQRLLALEQDHAAQRRAWIAAAAKNAGLHRPADAVELVDPARIVTSDDADKQVAALAQ